MIDLDLEGLAQELGLTEHVVFTGEVSDPELAALYLGVRFFCSLRRRSSTNITPRVKASELSFLRPWHLANQSLGQTTGRLWN